MSEKKTFFSRAPIGSIKMWIKKVKIAKARKNRMDGNTRNDIRNYCGVGGEAGNLRQNMKQVQTNEGRTKKQKITQTYKKSQNINTKIVSGDTKATKSRTG